jgi:hypothetical protein
VAANVPLPAHFAASATTPPRAPLPDDHPLWRLVGAWIATRQRGDADLIAGHVVADAELAGEVLADARRVIEAGGGPLRTGAELDVAVTARLYPDGRATELDVRLAGRLLGGDGASGEETRLVSHLTIAEAVDAGERGWKIARLLDAQSRALLADPAFARFLADRPTRPPA